MKKTVLLFLFIFFAADSYLSAQSMRTLFVSMPDSIMPLLTKNNREDCIDFIDAGMQAVVTNRLDSKSELLQFTPNFLHLRTSKAGSMQLKILPTADDTLVCVVNTICAEACDSRIAFYTRKWQPMDSKKYFAPPIINDFFIPSDSVAELLDIADIYLVKISLSANDNTLVAEYTMPQYMLQGDSARVASNLRRLKYNWDGDRFVKE